MYSPPGVVDPIHAMSLKKGQTGRKAKKSGATTRKASTTKTTGVLGNVNTIGYRVVSSTPQTLRVRGREILGSLSALANASSLPMLVGMFDLNPAVWTNSRLALVARTYEKYRYNSFTLRYKSSAPATAAGLTVLSAEFDATEQILSGDSESVTHAANNAVFGVGNVARDFQTIWRRSPTDMTWYYATSTPEASRETSQALVFSLSTASSLALGLVEIEYEIDFVNPELERGIAAEQLKRDTFGINGDTTVNGGLIKVATPGGLDVNRVYEVRNASGLSDAAYNFGGNGATTKQITWLAGAILFLAWSNSEQAWLLYPDISAAVSQGWALYRRATLSLSMPCFYRALTSYTTQ